jgi:hypothetical protein
LEYDLAYLLNAEFLPPPEAGGAENAKINIFYSAILGALCVK